MDGLENPSQKGRFRFGLSSTTNETEQNRLMEQSAQLTNKGRTSRASQVNRVPYQQRKKSIRAGMDLRSAPPARMMTTAAAAARSQKFDTTRFGGTRPRG